MIRRALAAVAVVAAAALLVGCAAAGGAARGGSADGGSTNGGTGAGSTTSKTLEWDGLSREYLVHVPAKLPAHPALVVMLHGGFGSAAQAESKYGWDELADSEGFIVAYPNGSGKAWNGGDCCGAAARNNVDDVGFIGAVVDRLRDQYGVSAAYGTGMSNGAIMTYRLACETAIFDAIAPVSGTFEVPCDDPRPVSVLHIHGLEDEAVPFAGGPGKNSDGISRVDGPSIPDVIAAWRSTDQCGVPAAVDRGDPLVVDSRSECADGRAVELITIADAGHQWPGSEATRDGSDPPSKRLDATTAIWEFFRSVS